MLSEPAGNSASSAPSTAPKKGGSWVSSETAVLQRLLNAISAASLDTANKDIIPSPLTSEAVRAPAFRLLVKQILQGPWFAGATHAAHLIKASDSPTTLKGPALLQYQHDFLMAILLTHVEDLSRMSASAPTSLSSGTSKMSVTTTTEVHMLPYLLTVNSPASGVKPESIGGKDMSSTLLGAMLRSICSPDGSQLSIITTSQAAALYLAIQLARTNDGARIVSSAGFKFPNSCFTTDTDSFLDRTGASLNLTEEELSAKCLEVISKRPLTLIDLLKYLRISPQGYTVNVAQAVKNMKELVTLMETMKRCAPKLFSILSVPSKSHKEDRPENSSAEAKTALEDSLPATGEEEEDGASVSPSVVSSAAASSTAVRVNSINENAEELQKLVESIVKLVLRKADAGSVGLDTDCHLVFLKELSPSLYNFRRQHVFYETFKVQMAPTTLSNLLADVTQQMSGGAIDVAKYPFDLINALKLAERYMHGGALSISSIAYKCLSQQILFGLGNTDWSSQGKQSPSLATAAKTTEATAVIEDKSDKANKRKAAAAAAKAAKLATTELTLPSIPAEHCKDRKWMKKSLCTECELFNKVSTQKEAYCVSAFHKAKDGSAVFTGHLSVDKFHTVECSSPLKPPVAMGGGGSK